MEYKGDDDEKNPVGEVAVSVLAYIAIALALGALLHKIIMGG